VYGAVHGRPAKPRLAAEMTRPINEALMQLQRRAESSDREFLRRSFVDVPPLAKLLASRNHQVLFGRRGTGKTHALRHLAEQVSDGGDVPVEIDLRTAGAVGAYSSAGMPLDQRATGLLADVLGAVHNALVDHALAATGIPLSPLDELADAASQVEVVGSVEAEFASEASSARERSRHARLGISLSGVDVGADLGRNETASERVESRLRELGVPELHINFGAVSEALGKVAAAFAPRRVWVLFDEWSSVPIELQPLLADLIRRCILPVPGFTAKIAAIEDRSSFRVSTDHGDYIGIELGSDVTADVDLDAFLVSAHDPERAIQFFSALFYKHVTLSLPDGSIILRSPRHFVLRAFRDQGTFTELVRAAAGVPRDAINVAALAAQSAGESSIRLTHLRAAARDWYQRDKEAPIRRSRAKTLLDAIVDEVIGRRKKRTFLLRQDTGGSEHYLVRELYDARLIHLVKRGIASPSQPSARFDAYSIDYGCYVDLTTADKISGSRELWSADVPPDNVALLENDLFRLDEFDHHSDRRSTR
jgi:hypothetical protein